MADARVAYSTVAGDAPAQGSLFAGIRFWVAMRVPMRSHFIDQIRINGGSIVPLETHADVKIADGARKDPPPDTFSFKWIEQCIAEGLLVDREPFRAGPAARSARPVGAMRPAKAGRNPYSAEDDRALYDWVKDAEMKGNAVGGNEIYKQFEQVNPRHPWQSWRDRYLKFLKDRPPRAAPLQETPPTPPSENAEEESPTGTQSRHVEAGAATAMQSKAAASTSTETKASANIHSDRRAARESAMDGAQAEPNVPSQKTSEFPASTPTHGKQESRQSLSARRPRLSGTPIQGQRRQIENEEEDYDPDLSNITFAQEDYDFLMENAVQIQDVTVGNYESAWRQVATTQPHHSAAVWRKYYETVVLPEWRRCVKGFDASSHSRDNRTSTVGSQAREPDDMVDSSTFPTHPADTVIQAEQQLLETPKRKQEESDEESAFNDEHQGPLKRRRRSSEPSPVDGASGLYTSTNTAVPQTAATSQHSKKTEVISLLDSDDGDDEDDEAAFQTSTQRPERDTFRGAAEEAIPEGEKENMILDGEGSPVAIPAHKHVKSKEAMEVFTDPPSDFLLQQNDEFIHIEEVKHSAKENVEVLEELRSEWEENQFDTQGHGTNAEDEVDESSEGSQPDAEDATHSTRNMDGQTLRFDPPPALLEDDGLFFHDDDYNERSPSPHGLGEQGFPDSDSIVPDLDIPLPQDFDLNENEPQEAGSRDEDFDNELKARHQRAFLDTQAILNSDTQDPDLDVPPPLESQDVPSSPPKTPPVHPTISTITLRRELREQFSPSPDQHDTDPLPPNPYSDSPQDPESPDVEALIQAFIQEQVAAGHDEEHVLWALQRTSMDSALARRVLASVARGEEMPRVRGVWTEEDDAKLEGKDGRAIREVTEFHGAEASEQRLTILQEWSEMVP